MVVKIVECGELDPVPQITEQNEENSDPQSVKDPDQPAPDAMEVDQGPEKAAEVRLETVTS